MTGSALTPKERIDRWRGFMLAPDTLERFQAMLPSAIGAERFYEVVLTQMRRIPRLAECTPESLLGGMAASASMGLMPDGRQGALVPFKNKGRLEATWIPMYQGLVQLMYRSGQVVSVSAEVVWREDQFEWLGPSKPPLHLPYFLRSGVVDMEIDDRNPFLVDEPTSLRAVWAGVAIRGGGFHCAVLPLREIAKIRRRSRGALYHDGNPRMDSPWNHPDDWAWMAKKTVLRAVAKLAPQSYELTRALDLDDAAESGKDQALESPIRTEAVVIDELEPPPSEPVGRSDGGAPDDAGSEPKSPESADWTPRALDWREGLAQVDSFEARVELSAEIGERATDEELSLLRRHLDEADRRFPAPPE